MRSSFHLMQVSRRQPPQGFNGCTGADEPWRGSLSDRVLNLLHPSNSAGDGSLRSRLWPLQRVRSVQHATVSPATIIARAHLHCCRTFVPAQMGTLHLLDRQTLTIT